MALEEMTGLTALQHNLPAVPSPTLWSPALETLVSAVFELDSLAQY